MDLSTIKPVEREYEIKHPGTGEGTGLILTLACTHDERVKAAIREANDHYLKSPGEKKSEKDLDAYDNAIAASYVVNLKFTGDAEWRGGKPKYSLDLAKDICSHDAFKEQVIREVKKVRDFYKA